MGAIKSSLAAVFEKYGIQLPDHSEDDIPALLADNSTFESQIPMNGLPTPEDAPEEIDWHSEEPQSEPSTQPPAENLAQQAALEEFESSFPYGYEIMDTSSEGLLCGWHSVILSMSAQYPDLPCPSRDELQEIFDSQTDEFAEVFDMDNSNNFSIDQVALVLYSWGMSHGLNLRIGYQEEGEAPLLVSHPNDDLDILTLWIHNDGAYLTSIGHFSGMRPRTVEQYVLSESFQHVSGTLLQSILESHMS